MDVLASPTSSTNLNPSTGSLTPSPATRPVTSKARGVCKYYTDPRGCYAKDQCKFLHSEPPKEGEEPALTPYDRSKTCKFYSQGYCRRGDECWFLHADAKGKGPLEEEDDLCSICFEKPTTYGLLTGCSHIFCTTCIKQWRDPSRKPIGVLDSGNTKRCPMCRAPSRFITPSSKFWPDGSTEKQKTVESYRESMARVQCRFFQKSIRKDRLICPFGNECFYQHKKPDGTIHLFRDGVEESMRVRSILFSPHIYVNAFYSRSDTVSGTTTAVDLP
ncbi:hypothetical protein HYPSUDRAFT_137701 [Hypholoma sublateritium FD-334 SS-4]|uniref:RING-type E3 ubiquitin transferase n=1 Tax=Hypholoma sublateritium (strain FD-334 SS-4) TaxID=945553 RepID=A0A0D2MIX7_HYPSF|nr:hypothetical protein HYPSUDRAFT_137701 [Hypholoma sublateritium FD-334 SS-4]